MRFLRQQAGMTLIEVIIAVAITSVVFVPLGAILAQQIRAPIKTREEVVTFQQLQQANLLVREDASVAREFEAGVEPDYGTFEWFEFSGNAAVPVSTRYYWDPGGPSTTEDGVTLWPNGSIKRVVERNGEVTPAQIVLERVLRYEDFQIQYLPSEWDYDQVTRTWSYREGQATITATVQSPRPVGYGKELERLQRGVVMVADARPQKDLPASLPGRLPPPPPLPNQIDFYVSGEPTLSVGSYRSGSGADLKLDDAQHYITRGAGNPRTVVFEVTSEAIDYTDITSLIVSFTSQATKDGVSVEVYIYNPNDAAHTDGGYDTSPDGATVLASVNTDKTILAALGAADLTYLNSLAAKTVRIKVRATASSVYDLAADQVVFQAAGQPAPTFFRDFLVAEAPVVEAGSVSGGTYVSLEKDDTAYFSVTQANNVVQWTVVSQAFAFDTISSIEVFLTARTTKGAPIQEIFVFNPTNPNSAADGYLQAPSSTFTYDATGADRTASFTFAATDVDYVASLFPQEVRIRVKGTDSTPQWVLEADQITFRVRP